MKFKHFKEKLQQHFNQMVDSADTLFEVDADKDKLWEIYLSSFPAGTNELYRERTEHDCSACRHFIRQIGALVVIRDNKLHTIWEFDAESTTYQPVVDSLDAYVKSKAVSGVFISRDKKIGVDKNHEILSSGKVLTWEHLYVELPKAHVYTGGKSIGEVQNEYRTQKEVFKRSLEEITEEAVATVLELISSNTLYRGEEWKSSLERFAEYQRRYSEIPQAEKDNFAWAESVKAGVSVAKIRNHSIGTLLVNISAGEDLDSAVRKYEAIVAPANYKRPKAIFTKRMLEEAKDKITQLGYMDSLSRRFATLDDITVNNILFSNKDAAKRISGAHDVFDSLMGEVKTAPKTFSRVEEIPVEKFVSDVLPGAQELEVFLESKHAGNMVSLIAPAVKDSKTMFKWDNGFSWAYSGNVADSMLKERVKSAGGKVDGVLRFSIQWNDTAGEHDGNDLDAHCSEPSCEHIYYGSPVSRSGGNLDVDIRIPRRGVPAIENITWPDIRRMGTGTYTFSVHNYEHRGGRGGFRAEIEFGGQIYSFDYNKEVRNHEKIPVAAVTLSKNGNFSIKEFLPFSASANESWGVKTNSFVPVSVVMFSPNYWDEQKGVGNKHYFFMLKGCVNPESPNGFYNEYLREDLLAHKRVFEALGGKMAVESVEDQLSGVGFSSTKRNELIVKVKGQTERVMKIKF